MRSLVQGFDEVKGFTTSAAVLSVSLATVHFYYVSVCVSMWRDVHMHAGAQGQQEKALDALELELEQVVSWQPRLRTELGSSERAVLAFCH